MDDKERLAKRIFGVIRGAVDRGTKQRSRDSILENAKDDDNDVLAQREVGTGACGYCSSRGNSKPVPPQFVSKEYHQYCKCHIRLVFSKVKKSATGSGSVGKATYLKRRGSLELVERIGIDMLTFHGISPTVVEEDPKAAANIDLQINGEKWEMKNVINGKSSLKSQLKRARKKWFKLSLDEPIRVVFTTYQRTDSFEEIVRKARRKTGFDEAIVISEDEIAFIKNR